MKHKNCLVCELAQPLYCDGIWRSDISISAASNSEAGTLLGYYFILSLILLTSPWLELGVFRYIVLFVFIIYSLVIIPYFLKQLYFEYLIRFHKRRPGKKILKGGE